MKRLLNYLRWHKHRIMPVVWIIVAMVWGFVISVLVADCSEMAGRRAEWRKNGGSGGI